MLPAELVTQASSWAAAHTPVSSSLVPLLTEVHSVPFHLKMVPAPPTAQASVGLRANTASSLAVVVLTTDCHVGAEPWSCKPEPQAPAMRISSVPTLREKNAADVSKINLHHGAAKSPAAP